MKSEKADLSYSHIEREHLSLARAAAWHFGNWRGAIEAAGIEYESIGRYRRWNRKRIIERIRELHAQGADLNWRAVSTQVDPSLAAAALRKNSGFKSWSEAVQEAGLSMQSVSRYRKWDGELVIDTLKEMHKRRQPLSSRAVQSTDQKLFCAARRYFGTWDAALEKAGIASQNERRAAAQKRAQLKQAAQAEKQSAKMAKAAALLAGKNAAAQVKTSKPSAQKNVSTQPTKISAQSASAQSATSKTSAPKTAAKATKSSTQASPKPIAKSAKTTKNPSAKTASAKAPVKETTRKTTSVKASTAKKPSTSKSAAKTPARRNK